MGIGADISGDWHAALAALAWQVDLGLTDALEDAPIDRFARAEAAAADAPARQDGSGQDGIRTSRAAPQSVAPPAATVDAVALATAAAAQAGDLAALADSIAAFDHCALKQGARTTVFADGNPAARVMIVGEAPGRDEDIAGRPFVGRAGQLLDRMLAAIGLSRGSPDAQAAVYITNVMPWRPPGNREPDPDEIAMMRPFLLRHIALADPDLLVLVGNTPCMALLGSRGIMRLRGRWTEVAGRPAMPMVHPAYHLRNPDAKREAWADLLEIDARLRAGRQP